MQKKLLAVAVAGVLAAPGLAMAQSAVTISGVFKVGFQNYSVGNAAAARAGLNTSEWAVVDNSSRMIFNVTEDLGSGMQAIGQVDMRFGMDDTTAAALNASGNTWVGLRGNSWGTVTFGRHDLHYGKQPDDIATKAGALMATAVSLMDYVANGTTAIAGGTRTANVIRYDTPTWSGFNATVAYSSNPTVKESDLTTGGRKGNAWNLNPQYTAANWQIGWSYWKQKADVPAAGSDQTGNSLYGYFLVGNWKLGLGYNSSHVDNGLTGARQFDRNVWTIPVRWASGPHNVFVHYTKANADKVIGGDSGAKMWAAAYVYDLSKRTSVGVTWAQISNGTLAAYNFFTATTFAGNGVASNPGEKPRMIQFTVRHAF